MVAGAQTLKVDVLGVLQPATEIPESSLARRGCPYGTTAMPHGLPPTAICFSTLPDRDVDDRDVA